MKRPRVYLYADFLDLLQTIPNHKYKPLSPTVPAPRVKVTQAFPKKQRISELQQESSSRSPSHMGSLGEVTESGRPPSTQ